MPRARRIEKLKGCIITIDAMGCQKEIVRGIVARKADYVLAVKGNQDSLHKAVLAAFAQLDSDPAVIPHAATEAMESGHGRKECRRATAIGAMKHLPDEIRFLWPKLETLARIQSETHRAGKMVQEERFYISTLPMDKVETIANSVRSHWGIENELHWVLDVAFREDGIRTRRGNGHETGAILRHITLNMLRQDPNTKRSIRHRRLKAALSQGYLWQRGAPFKMTAAKVRLAQAAMGKAETIVGVLCRELGVPRQTLYRHVGPDGSLREDGQKLLQ